MEEHGWFGYFGKGRALALYGVVGDGSVLFRREGTERRSWRQVSHAEIDVDYFRRDGLDISDDGCDLRSSIIHLQMVILNIRVIRTVSMEQCFFQSVLYSV